MPKPFPKEFREDVVRVARSSDASVAQVAKDFGISESCLHREHRLIGSRPAHDPQDHHQHRSDRKSDADDVQGLDDRDHPALVELEENAGSRSGEPDREIVHTHTPRIGKLPLQLGRRVTVIRRWHIPGARAR